MNAPEEDNTSPKPSCASEANASDSQRSSNIIPYYIIPCLSLFV